jgi:hypothetical protein
MPHSRKKFTTQVDAKVLAAVRDLAEKEGRQIQSLVDEARPIWSTSTATPARGLMSWRPISPAMKSTALYTRSSLNDRLPDAGQRAGH